MTTTASIQNELQYAENAGLLSAFTAASFHTGIDRNMLLAIASRESNMGRSLDANSLGDGGNGIGIMQIDRRYHPEFVASVQPADHGKVILKGAQILKEYTRQFEGNIRYGVAAYNAGPGNVRKALAAGLDPDAYTTGRNYSRDVLQRYEIFKSLTGSVALSEFNVAGMSGILLLVLASAVAGTAFLIANDK